MKPNRWIVPVAGTALVGLAASFAARSSLDAEEKKPPADRDNPFAGKVVVVLEKGDVGTTGLAALENPAFLEIKGQRFLTGKRVGKPESAWNGVKAYLAFDNVASIYEFDNVEAFREFEEKVTEETEAAGRLFEDMILPNPAIPRVLPQADE